MKPVDIVIIVDLKRYREFKDAPLVTLRMEQNSARTGSIFRSVGGMVVLRISYEPDQDAFNARAPQKGRRRSS